MSLSVRGGNTSSVEVTNISGHGLWMIIGEKEYFLSYDDFPWFKDQPVSKICNVEEPSKGRFFWPALDIDLGIASIENPERFPLKASLG